jgi:hypothetical protein
MAERKKRAKEAVREAEDSDSNALIDLSASIITVSTKKTRKLFIIGLKKSTKSSIPLKRSRAYNNNNDDKDDEDAILYKGMRIKYKLGASISTSRTKLKKVTFTPLVPMPIKLLTLIIQTPHSLL